MKKVLSIILSVVLTAVVLASCGSTDSGKTEETAAPKPVTNLSKPDMTKWRFIEEKDVYYQVGIDYCETPADERYEKLAVFVPGAYLDATDNGDGTFTCVLNESAELGGYTALNAPITMQIYTPAYVAADALTDEFVSQNKTVSEEIAETTSQGVIYVCPGCRGINEGAPAGVTDLKAAIRYLRYADDVFPGDAESIFVFGMSGGGAQAAILGASGDSALYDPYLEAIGAVQGVSDCVKGAMAWCPVTNLGTANAEYEWMMGCTRKGRTDEENALSDGLANAYAEYVNSAGFKDENGKTLTLTQSDDGIYQAGSYYDYVKSVIETSLNHYLSDRDFGNSSAQEYIDGLNADQKWITYDKSTNTASITSVADFVNRCKVASDTVVAFDWPNSYNTLFGYGDGKGAHFDSILADVLTQQNSEYAQEYIDDFKKTDSFGYSVKQRVDMYTPLYYLMESEDGYGSANVAPYWRIRTGIEQNTNASTTEINLALALDNYDGVQSVDFETVWAQGHEPAERTGNSNENFIAWVNSCMN
ncbi:MAG: tannase [Ruminococcus sp.]|nr:tannase [Ruminococcus sp.]